MANDYRYKLMKTFWFAVKQTGMTEDEARAFAWAKYQKRISMLTEDQLYERTVELAKIHHLDIGIPKRPQKKKTWYKKARNPGDRLELASLEQMEMIGEMAGKIGLSDAGIFVFLKKMGWVPGTPVGLIPAQKTIEAFKAMWKRGYKPKKQTIYIPKGVAWN